MTVARQGTGDEPVCARNPGILYGLGNLVENAVDFAQHTVTVETRWDDNRVSVTICDDGPGFSSDILSRLGEPYLSSRHQDRRAKVEEDAGLGLGLFIAKTLLERSGAKLVMHNAIPPASGAIVKVDWPRQAFEQGRTSPAQPGRTALQSPKDL